MPYNRVKLQHQVRAKWRKLLSLGLLMVGILLSSWLLVIGLNLQTAASKPVDAFFVLGGSIYREIYVAQLAKQYPETQILISQGSTDPCILLIFQREQAPIRQVWLEKCADSTFDNFYFNIPILEQWNVRKVKLITSPSHLPRAKWMAQILFGAHGIWVETDIVEEVGKPGNRESALKTGLDLIRSLAGALVSQVIQPKCVKVVPLAAVDLEAWRISGFRCQDKQKLNLY